MAWINRPINSLVRINIARPYLLKTPAIVMVPLVFETTMAETVSDSRPLPFSSVPNVTLRENVMTFMRRGIENYHHIVGERFEEFGPIYKEKTHDGSVMVNLCDPDDYERVFLADSAPSLRPNFIASTRFFVDQGLTEGLIGNDEHAIRHRSVIAPLLLKPQQMKEYVPLLYEVADDTVSQMKIGRNEDLFHHILKWSMEGIGAVMFGRRIGVNANNPSEKSLAFIHAILQMFKIETKFVTALPFYKYFKTPTLKRLFQHAGTIVSLANTYVEDAKANPDASETVVGATQKMVNDQRNILSDEEIKQMAAYTMVGGVDAGSITATNALYNMAQHQDAQEKLYEEIQRVLPNDKPPTHKDLLHMPYLTAVIKESLRYTVTGTGFVRVLRQPIVLSGYEIPANVQINLSTIPSKEMAKVTYGDDYDSFKPERWLRESTSKIHRFATLPFGFGSRKCIGREITQIEIKLLLINMLRRFKLEKSDLEEDKMSWKFAVIMSPGVPFNLTLKERK